MMFKKKKQPNENQTNSYKQIPVEKKPFRIWQAWVTITIIIACTATAGVLVYLLSSIDTTPVSNFILQKPKNYYSSLSGLKVENQDSVNKPITAIMIENSGDARPQSGLAAAEIVFEAVAEGGITRFLALYQTSQPQLIGPVRSLRPYYVSWLAPFNASVAHVGGSARALSEIRNGQYRDIDQFFNGDYYWRTQDRVAPHNVYTSFEKLNSLNSSKGYESSNPDMFLRQEPKKSPEITASQVDIKISSGFYNSSYKYDAETNLYTRWQAGAVHNDREAGAITTNSVIALKVDNKRVLEDGYREDIETIGEGKVYIFQNGSVIEATWRKPEQFKQIRFYDAEGKEIAINRGKVWISAVPNNGGDVTWK